MSCVSREFIFHTNLLKIYGVKSCLWYDRIILFSLQYLQIDNYLKFIAEEEEAQRKQSEAGDKNAKKKEKKAKPGKDIRKNVTPNKDMAKTRQEKTKRHVAFSSELCLQSSVEELDEKEGRTLYDETILHRF